MSKLLKYINNFNTEKFKYQYRFSIDIGFALKFNYGTIIAATVAVSVQILVHL